MAEPGNPDSQVQDTVDLSELRNKIETLSNSEHLEDAWREILITATEITKALESGSKQELLKTVDTSAICKNLWGYVYTNVAVESSPEQSQLLNEIVDVRRTLTAKLHSVGLDPICPRSGEPFNRDYYNTQDKDLVWLVGNDPSYEQKNNKIESVKRTGMIDTQTGQVIRKAWVSKYVRQESTGSSGGIDELRAAAE